jgi:hypothetical protein
MAKWNRGLRVGALVLGGAALIIAGKSMEPRGAKAGSSIIVPIELVLLIDTSGSVDSNEYQMQKQGYVNAFKDPLITDQIETLGGIAVVYIEWDEAKNQTIRVPWTHLRTHADCVNFSSKVEALTRKTSGTTMVAPALAFATKELKTNSFMGLRRVIDVSGDGICKNWQYYKKGIEDSGKSSADHYGTPWDEAIAGLAGTVDVVNGVFIGSPGTDLEFYKNSLPQGDNSFALHANSFWEFSETVKEKIAREIGVNIPGTFD